MEQTEIEQRLKFAAERKGLSVNIAMPYEESLYSESTSLELRFRRVEEQVQDLWAVRETDWQSRDSVLADAHNEVRKLRERCSLSTAVAVCGLIASCALTVLYFVL